MKAALLTLLSVLSLLPFQATAADFYVDIANETDYTIMYMYVSPDNSDSWEEDVLGDNVLRDGEERRVTLTGYKSPIFDIKLVDEDGDSYTFWDVDVSERDITATIKNLDK